LEIKSPENEWKSDFGKSYTTRNNLSLSELDKLYFDDLGVTRSELNNEFLGNLDRKLKILEIGCNIGNQLKLLQNMGFEDLWGIDVSAEAISIAKRNTDGINIIKSSAHELPFKNEYFDLVFTSRVLIHIDPSKLNEVIDNMYDLSKRYIWCFEYFSTSNTEVEYRGKTELLWKNDFLSAFLERHSDLTVVKSSKYKYQNNNNVDNMFLLSKQKERN
jgi:pseudaminic acid biosynthesis-associated methylase